MDRTKITIELWPKGFAFEGKRTRIEDRFKPERPVFISAPPGDLELLIAEYKRCPDAFEQEAARSFEAALREWREEIAAEDEEHFNPRQSEEVPPYGEAEE